MILFYATLCTIVHHPLFWTMYMYFFSHPYHPSRQRSSANAYYYHAITDSDLVVKVLADSAKVRMRKAKDLAPRNIANDMAGKLSQTSEWDETSPSSPTFAALAPPSPF